MVGKIKNTALFIILLTTLLVNVSANIILTQEPQSLYNIGDKIEITAKITPETEISDIISFYLSCPNGEIEANKEFMHITTETQKQITIPLGKEYIGELSGQCEIKSAIGTETKTSLSKPFKISNILKIKLDNSEEFTPGETITITGTVTKENGENANGKIEAKLNEIQTTSEILDGNFEIQFLLPENTKAGEQNIELKAYEQNKFNSITNHKEETQAIKIRQVPTNIEILIEEKEIIAGEKLIGTILLKDQTGENIKRNAYIAIKNEYEEIMTQIETETGKEFSYEIPYYEKPSSWTISTYSGEIINKMNFKILERKEISIILVNKTIILENKGNVIYNQTIDVKIGEETIEIPTNLQIKEIVKYEVKAPTGQYNIKVGDVEQMMSLTGNAIKLQKITDTSSSSFKTFSWTFLIIILALATYIIFNKAKNKKFFGKKTGKLKSKPLELQEIPQPEKLIQTKTNAQISTSITGGKQNAPIGCIMIKNYEETRFGEGGVRETMQEIANQIEANKGIIYESKGNIFFIIPPTKTKSYQNEIPAINVMKFAQKLLNAHNKKFKQKISFGLSLNYGTIVTNETENNFRFMTMGTLITDTRKLSRMSTGQIIIGEKFNEKIKDKIKVQRIENEEIKAYEFISIKEEHNNDQSSTFIKGFLARQARDKK